MTDIPATPHSIEQVLWVGMWVFGGTIAVIAAAFSSLAWWTIKRSDAAAKRCEETSNASEDRHRQREQESAHRQHAAAMAFANGLHEHAQELRLLRIKLGDDRATPEPQPIVNLDPSTLHQSGLRVLNTRQS